MFLTEILNQFIFFSNDSTLIAILWLLAIVFQHEHSIHIIQLLCATLIINIWLKHLWLIPLPYKSTTYAFPSGHMHSATICYLYLFFLTQYKIIKLLLITVLAGIAFAEINLGFHNIVDISGGIGFGIMHIVLYLYTIQYYGNFKTTLFLTLLCLPIVLTYHSEFPFMIECLLILSVNLLMFNLPLSKNTSNCSNIKKSYLVILSSLCLIAILVYCINNRILPQFHLPLYFGYLIGILIPILIFSPSRLKEFI